MGMEKKCENCGTEITKEYCEGYPEVCEHWTPKKPQTNGDRIREMSNEELAKFLECLAFSRETPWTDPFARKVCDNCPTVRCVAKETGEEMELHECDFEGGECPHGDDVLWWLKQPVEEVKG